MSQSLHHRVTVPSTILVLMVGLATILSRMATLSVSARVNTMGLGVNRQQGLSMAIRISGYQNYHRMILVKLALSL